MPKTSHGMCILYVLYESKWECALNKVQPMFYYHHLVQIVRSVLRSLAISLKIGIRNPSKKPLWKSTYVADDATALYSHPFLVAFEAPFVVLASFLLCFENCIVNHNFCGRSVPYSLFFIAFPLHIQKTTIWRWCPCVYLIHSIFILSSSFNLLSNFGCDALWLRLKMNVHNSTAKYWLFSIYVNMRFTCRLNKVVP